MKLVNPVEEEPTSNTWNKNVSVELGVVAGGGDSCGGGDQISVTPTSLTTQLWRE